MRRFCGLIGNPSSSLSHAVVRSAGQRATHSYTALDSPSLTFPAPVLSTLVRVTNFRHLQFVEDYLDRYPLYWATSNDQPAAVQWLLQNTCLPVVRISGSCMGCGSSVALPTSALCTCMASCHHSVLHHVRECNNQQQLPMLTVCAIMTPRLQAV